MTKIRLLFRPCERTILFFKFSHIYMKRSCLIFKFNYFKTLSIKFRAIKTAMKKANWFQKLSPHNAIHGSVIKKNSRTVVSIDRHWWITRQKQHHWLASACSSIHINNTQILFICLSWLMKREKKIIADVF